MSVKDQEKTTDDRRDFLKKSALAAGAVAGVAAVTSTTTNAAALDGVAASKPTVEVALKSPKITALQLDDLMRKILEINGCPNCGFSGFDLRIRVDEFIDVGNAYTYRS